MQHPGRCDSVAPMTLRSALLAPLLLAAACGSKSSTGSTMPSTTPTPPAGVAVLLTGAGDLDGKAGDETITLYADGTLIAGNWQGKAFAEPGSEYFQSKQATISVAVLDKATRVVVIALPTAEEEDPPNHYEVLAPKGDQLLTIFEQTVGNYGVTDLVFPGDGTMRYVQDSWTACGGGEPAASPAPIHEVVFAADASGALVEREKKPTGETFDCNNLAACPWVYVVGADGPVRIGEILRDVRGKAAYTLQELALPAADRGPLHVRVAEEEDEVTFLDEVYVEVDGAKLAPAACATTAAPAYCAADHVPYRMQKGDVLDLAFDLPASSTPTIFARGYYVPTPSRAAR